MAIGVTSKSQDNNEMLLSLTIPTEVIAVTVLMMVGMGLNLPAWKVIMNNIMIVTTITSWWTKDDGVSTYVSVNYDIQTDAISLNKCPRLYPIFAIIFGKPGQWHRNHKGKGRET